MTSPWCLCVFVCAYVVMLKQWGDSMADSSGENSGDSPEPFVSQVFLQLQKQKNKEMSSVPFLLQITATSRTPGADISWYVTVYVSEPQTPAQKAKQTSRSLSQDLVISHNDNHNILQRCALNWPFKYITKRRNPPESQWETYERINPWTWGSISVSLAALWCFGKESLKAAIVFLYNTRHWTTFYIHKQVTTCVFLTNTKTAPQAERGPCWVFVCVIRSHRVSRRWRVWHKQHRCITQKAHIFYTYLKWSLIKVKKTNFYAVCLILPWAPPGRCKQSSLPSNSFLWSSSPSLSQSQRHSTPSLTIWETNSRNMWCLTQVTQKNSSCLIKTMIIHSLCWRTNKCDEFTNPELVVLSSRAFLNEGTVISSNVSMVGITF